MYKKWVKHVGGGGTPSYKPISVWNRVWYGSVWTYLSGLNSKWIRKKWDFLGSEIGTGFGETGGTTKTKSTSQAISHGNLLKKYQTVDNEN